MRQSNALVAEVSSEQAASHLPRTVTEPISVSIHRSMEAANDANADETSEGARHVASFRSRGITALKLFFLSIASLGASILVIQWVDNRVVLGIALALSAALAFASLMQGIRAILTPGPAENSGGLLALVVLFPVLGGLVLSLFGALLSLMTTADFSRGRQLRRRGKILRPTIAQGDAWLTALPPVPRRHPWAEGIAEQWRENGRTEHASVAAFSRLTLELMALGAPPKLIRGAQQDALDEIAHTEMCFSIAQSFDGQSQSPGPFPEARHQPFTFGVKKLDFAQLAVSSLIDGALHEGLSAAVIAKLAKRCTMPNVRGVLLTIAADEGRHAAHGWDVVEWCLAEGGVDVAHALVGATAVLPQQMDTHRPADAEAGLWEPFGIHGSALESAEYEKARARVVAHVEELVKPVLGKATGGVVNAA